MVFGVIGKAGSEFSTEFSHDFALFFVKYPCAIALHLILYPEVARGMMIMKFANNQPESFVEYGSEVAFVIGFCQATLGIIAEFINLELLAFQHTIQHCIIHFVALEIIMELATIYFESLKDNKLAHIMHHPPKFTKHCRDISFRSRSPFHKFARALYKFFRCIYVSYVFYTMPFAVIVLQASIGTSTLGTSTMSAH